MKQFGILAQTTLLMVVLAIVVKGEQLENRHQLEIRLGAWNHDHRHGVETYLGDYGSRPDANGFTSSLSYSYFSSEALAMNMSIGMRSASAEAMFDKSLARLEAVSVVHILFGAKIYGPPSTYRYRTRPYLIVAVGPYIGSQTLVQGWNNSSLYANTETTLGALLGAGIDLILGSHFITGISLGYHLMADFDLPIGGLYNYNGPMLTIGLGYLFGGSRNL